MRHSHNFTRTQLCRLFNESFNWVCEAVLLQLWQCLFCHEHCEHFESVKFQQLCKQTSLKCYECCVLSELRRWSTRYFVGLCSSLFNLHMSYVCFIVIWVSSSMFRFRYSCRFCHEHCEHFETTAVHWSAMSVAYFGVNVRTLTNCIYSACDPTFEMPSTVRRPSVLFCMVN